MYAKHAGRRAVPTESQLNLLAGIAPALPLKRRRRPETRPRRHAPRVLAIVKQHAGMFTAEFLADLPDNLHVWDAFEREAMAIVAKGFDHYSAYTIIHVLRHHSALHEVGGEWKLNNNKTPCWARLWGLMHPAHAGLFEKRATKATQRTE